MQGSQIFELVICKLNSYLSKACAQNSDVLLYLKNCTIYSEQVMVSAMKKERNRWEIILDILKVTKEEKKVKKTRIMQRANLDWRNFKKYFNYLQADGFITKCYPDPDCYELTEKGKNLLQKLKEVAELIDVTPRISKQFQYPKIYPVISQEYPTKTYPAISQKETAAELRL